MPILQLDPDAPADRLYSVKELAKEWSRSATYVRDRLRDGSLGYVEMGSDRKSAPRIPASAARDFIARRSIPARRTA